MPVKSSSFKRENLRTIVEAEPLRPPVTYGDRIMLIGSCFTEHIGNRLKNLKFTTSLNPFGIVYNPLSMAGQIKCLLSPTGFTRDDLVYHQGLWHSWMHHSRFSHPDAAVLLQNLNEQAQAASAFLNETKMLIMTFGTPEAFYLHEGNRLVANCHKLPAGHFYSAKPDPQELATHWIPLLEQLYEKIPDLRICLTISPVRYFKDGPLGNQMSKSILFLFIGRLMDAFPSLFYFPSYEIFMDDLRDYRFYDTDLVHPGAAGIDYVWDRFAGACIDPAVYALMSEVESAVKGARHRSGNFLTDAHRTFVSGEIDKLTALRNRYPFLDFSEEIGLLQAQLNSDQS